MCVDDWFDVSLVVFVECPSGCDFCSRDSSNNPVCDFHGCKAEYVMTTSRTCIGTYIHTYPRLPETRVYTYPKPVSTPTQITCSHLPKTRVHTYLKHMSTPTQITCPHLPKTCVHTYPKHMSMPTWNTCPNLPKTCVHTYPKHMFTPTQNTCLYLPETCGHLPKTCIYT